MNAGFVFALWILFNLAIVGVYDTWAFFFAGVEDTVSYWFQNWFQKFPVLAVALGVLVGHLAWPLHREFGGRK
jgi:hypothetical protein